MDDDFCIIESYNPHDETINFGSRPVSEGNKLFEAVTLCSLNIKDFDHKTGTVKNIIIDDRIFLSIGNIFIIFGDRNCSSLNYLKQFEDLIDTFAISNNYLLLCLRNGNITLIDITSTLETPVILKNQNVDHSLLLLSNKRFIDCFMENLDHSNSKTRFLLITNQGIIYRIILDIPDKEVECRVETITSFNKLVEVAAICNNKIILNGSDLIIYDLNEHESYWTTGLSLKCLYPNNKNFIGLLNDGGSVNICSESLLIFPVATSEPLKDLLFFKYQGEEFIFVITEDASKEFHAKLMNMSELFEPIYDIKVVENVYLFNTTNVYDEQMCLCHVNDDEWRIQKFWENEPEKRLERLLKKELFEEAEEFAKSFNLNFELILKARAKNLLDKTVCDKEDTNKLIELLDSITDLAFKIDCCLNVTCDTFEDTRRILLYGAALDETNSGENHVNLFSRINEILYRFDTFTLLNRHNEFEFDCNKWNYFCNVNLLDQLCEKLRKCKSIEACIILYSRLDVTSLLGLSTDDISDILQLLGRMPSTMFIPFLQQFIPKTLQYLPSSLPTLVYWICECVFSLEKKDYPNFPENAINFLNKMILLIKIDDKSKEEIEAMTCNEYMENIFLFMKALKVIEHFKNNFLVFIRLQDCLQGPVSLVSVILLEEDINVDIGLMSFLVKYLIDNSFDPNNIFYNVIRQLIKYEESFWINNIYSIWHAINDAELKLDAILLIMGVAKTPWSAKIHDIIKEALELKHKLVHEVEKMLKMEPIYTVINREEYKLKNITYESILADMECKAIRRVIYCNRPTMEEDVFALCNSAPLKATAARLLLESYVLKSDMIACLNLIKKLSHEETKICINFYSTFLRTILSAKFVDLNVKENFYASFKMLKEKMLDNGLLYFDKEMQNSYAVLFINKNFDMEITYQQLLTNDKKCQLIEELLFKIDRNIQDGILKPFEVVKKCISLAHGLDYQVDEVLIKLCEKCLNLDVVHSCLEYLYESSYAPKTACQICMLLLRYKFCDNTITFLNDSTSLEEIPETTTPDINLYKSCLLLAQKLIVRCKSNNDSILTSAIISNWIDTALMILSDIKIGTNIFNTTSNPGLQIIRYFLNLYVGYLLDTNNINYSYFCLSKKQDSINQSKLEEMMHQLLVKIQNFCTSGNFLFTCKLILTIRSTLIFLNNIKPEVLNKLYALFIKSNTHLLENVFASEVFDENLAFSTLLYYKPEKAIKLVKQGLAIYKTNPEKFKTVAEIGLKLSNYHQLCSSNYSFFYNIILLLKWWSSKFEESICYKDFFLKKKELVLEKLIENLQLNITQIQEFCADFHLNVNDYYKLYLKQLLINEKPEYIIESNFNKKYVVMKNNDEDLFKKCMDVIELIKNKDYVLDFINTLWASINVYHYEVIICMLNIVTALGKPTDGFVKKSFLQFLKNYTRVSKPGANERELWFTSFPNTQEIDPLSEWRLPFTPSLFSNEVWNILNSEVTLETYTEWFSVLHILTNLKKDDICSYAVKEIVRSGHFKSEANDEWVVHSRYTSVFIEVDLCLQHISNLERATSVAYHLMMNTPKGADQVNAANLCYKYAEKYKNIQPLDTVDETTLQAFNKVEKKCHSLLATHILHLNNLALPKYLGLVTQPIELIEALYSDERIIKYSGPLKVQFPDINKAVEDLAKIYGINIQNKRMEILENYLSNSVLSNINLDETISLAPISNLISSDLEETNFKRASYICLSENSEFWQNYLFQKGFQQDSKYYDYRARALKCLVAIASTKDIESYIESLHSSYQEFLDFIEKLFLLHYLQCYGMNIDLEDLQKYNKKKLLLVFAKDLNNPAALKIMMSICLIFNITDLKYWKLILNKLIQSNSIKDLKTCLFFLRKEAIFYKKIYIDAWQTIINHSLEILKSNSNSEDINNLSIQHMLSIQACPVLLQIDLESTFDVYLQLERYDLAAVTVQYFTEEKISVCVKMLLQKVRKERLISLIQKLVEFGIVGTGYVLNFIDSQF